MAATRSALRIALAELPRWLRRRLAALARRTAARGTAASAGSARGRAALRALTAAALALPGLAAAPVRADEGDELRLQYGRYWERGRELFGADSRYDSIAIDSANARGRFTVLDRWKLGFGYGQDTWSGATPIATAPLVLGGNRAADGVSGATPYLQGDLFLDSRLRPLRANELGELQGIDTRRVHTLSSASPETRTQTDFTLGYEFDSGALEIGGGSSREDDHRAAFGSMRGRWDLDEKRTSVSLGLRYGSGRTRARLDHDAAPYLDTSAFRSRIRIEPGSGDRALRGNRRDWGAQLGLSRVLSRNTVLDAGVSFSRSSGYLSNPYRAVSVAFLDPEQQFQAPPGGYFGQLRALLEQRPQLRQQWSVQAGLVHYLEPFAASLHLGYVHHRDDWGVRSHSLEASWGQPLGSGWTLTPRVRYYSQSAADFYRTELISRQAYLRVISDPDTGDVLSSEPFDPRRLPRAFSSDSRLSGYGALSGGVTLSKQFATGLTVDLDFEYYRHAGRLRLGGGGERGFADLDSVLLSASVRLDASALRAIRSRSSRDVSAGPEPHHDHHGGAGAPAGVQYSHMLGEAGGWMLGASYMWSGQAGGLARGSHSVDDGAVLGAGCGAAPCRTAPRGMDMSMRMVELMYAPRDWMTLMLMGQLVEMDMKLRRLSGAADDIHASHPHATGGVGDTSLVGLVKLLELPGQRLHLGFGVSAPTGDVSIHFRRTHQQERGLTHYGMQLGSGTWDLLPSLTYLGESSHSSWGVQLSGVRRLERSNREGYRLGDVLQATAWGSYRLTRSLSVSGRLLYTAQDSIRGAYAGLHSDSGPMDFPGNYGGRFWDVGLGLSVDVPSGYLAGNRLSIEWLAPLRDELRGYQNRRKGSLRAAWSVGF